MNKMKKFLNKKVSVETVDKIAKVGYGIAIASLCMCAALAVIDKVGDK